MHRIAVVVALVSGCGRFGFDGASIDAGSDASIVDGGDGGMTSRGRRLALGDAHACLILDGGSVRCWGANGSGELGYGDTMPVGDNETPMQRGDNLLDEPALELTAGGSHTCARVASGRVRCWGGNSAGQLGYGDTMVRLAPGPDVELGGAAVELAAGFATTCARLAGGGVRCWGAGGNPLGYGNADTIGDNETPASVGDVPLGGTAIAISAGGGHHCALLDTQRVRCWGDNDDGELGYANLLDIGDNEPASSAGDVPVGVNLVAIAAGGVHTCAVTDAQNVRCWGGATTGSLGYGNVTPIGDTEPPSVAGDVPLGGVRIVAIAAGREHTCAIHDTGKLACWGNNAMGQLGLASTMTIGDTEPASSAAPVEVGANVVEVGLGRGHTCVLFDDGEVRCWGAGGILGYGNTTPIGDDEAPIAVDPVPIE
jgi:alpha-tubulin suppressor-like RCC1 family protein